MALFVLLPVILAPFQKYVLHLDIRVGSAGTVTGSYVAVLAVFGVCTMYLRILTGSLWTSVGFHLAFVLINRIAGAQATALIRFGEVRSESPIQLTALICVVICVVGLLVYPRMSRRPIGWSDIGRE